jgi:hypothetical protein
MPGEMSREMVLTQALEEARYYRRFHHTVWILWTTLYSAFLGAQVANLETIEKLRHSTVVAGTLTGCFFILLPLVIVYIFGHWHVIIFRLQALIAAYAFPKEGGPVLEEEESEKRDPRIQSGFTTLFHKHYGETSWHPLLVGRGHKLFILSFLVVVSANALVFWLA